jgi:ATP-dependent Clp endopeptidase proteolytic subunit ClpP
LPPTTSEIRLHINSPGGEVFEGIAILNALRAHSARVVAVVDGIAASAASFIACGADELVMAENSELMIHDAWGLCVGNAADMRETAGMLDHLSDNIASVYAKKAGTDVAAWRAAMSTETWYSAEEAVAAGLADRVDGAATSEAKNRYDLSIFNYAGRSEAPAPKAAMPDMAEHDFTDPDGDGFCDACVLEDDQGNCTQQCGMTAGLHSMTNAPEDATSPDAAATTTPENAADDEEFQLLASSLEHLSRF